MGEHPRAVHERDAAPGVQDEHVSPGYFAPGTTGSFDGIEIKNDSDVTANIDVEFKFIDNTYYACQYNQGGGAGQHPTPGYDRPLLTNGANVGLLTLNVDGNPVVGTTELIGGQNASVVTATIDLGPLDPTETVALDADAVSWEWPIDDGGAAQWGFIADSSFDTPLGMWLQSQYVANGVDFQAVTVEVTIKATQVN